MITKDLRFLSFSIQSTSNGWDAKAVIDLALSSTSPVMNACFDPTLKLLCLLSKSLD